MVGKTNAGGGGGGGKLYAIIAVTYPDGSVCTCSNGTKTLNARDTSGKALFNVTAGIWTVSCTDGSETASEAVSITEIGQIVSVSLSYGIPWFSDGVLNGECKNLGGYTTIKIEDGLLKIHALNAMSALIVMFSEPVPANVNTIKAKVKFTQTSTLAYQDFYVSTKNTWDASHTNMAASVALMPSSDYVEYTLDLSNITESVYIWFAINTQSSDADLIIEELVGV